MAVWITPHERRKKPAAPKPDVAVLEATDTGYGNAMVGASVEDALRLGVDWVRARRPHIGDNEQ